MKELLRAAKSMRDAALEFSITADHLNATLKRLSLAQKLAIQKQTGVYPSNEY